MGAALRVSRTIPRRTPKWSCSGRRRGTLCIQSRDVIGEIAPLRRERVAGLCGNVRAMSWEEPTKAAD